MQPQIPFTASGALPAGPVLIVEDDQELADALTTFLDGEGYPTTRVENGREALRYLRETGPPCLILLDLLMPVVDGFQFRREQLSDPVLADIPTVVTTAARLQTWEAEALSAHSYLAKPFDPEVLLFTVESLCRREGERLPD